MKQLLTDWMKRHPVLFTILALLFCGPFLYRLGYGIGKLIAHLTL